MYDVLNYNLICLITFKANNFIWKLPSDLIISVINYFNPICSI